VEYVGPLPNDSFKFNLHRYTLGVNEMGLAQTGIKLARARSFRISDEDDGFASLTPEDYVALRLETLQAHYQAGAYTRPLFG